MNIDLLLNRAFENINQRYFGRSEREFVAELYHQLRLTLSKNKKGTIEVTTETIKRQAVNYRHSVFNDSWVRQYFFMSRAYIIKGEYYKRVPDLLIHEYNNRNNQLLAFEVKNANGLSSTEIKIDLSKLIVYCIGNLKYNRGILIVYGQSTKINIKEMPDIKELLEQYPMIEIWVVERRGALTIINKSSC